MADEPEDPKAFQKSITKENKRHEKAIAKLVKRFTSKLKKGRR